MDTYLRQLDDLDYDTVEFIFDHVQVYALTYTTNARRRQEPLLQLRRYSAKLKGQCTPLHRHF